MKTLFYCLVIAAALFSCSAQKGEVASVSRSKSEFVGSRLAAQVFNRWEHDQFEATGKNFEVSKAAQCETMERIHHYVSQVRNKY